MTRFASGAVAWAGPPGHQPQSRSLWIGAKHAFEQVRHVYNRWSFQGGRVGSVSMARSVGYDGGEWWARWYPAADLAPGTLEAYAQQYRRHVGPRFARVRLDEVTALDLSQFARGLREGGLAPSSVAVAMAVIRDLLVDAATEGLIAVAPAGGIRQRRAGRGQPVRAGVAAELGTVLAVCGRLPAQEALMALTAVFTGRTAPTCASAGSTRSSRKRPTSRPTGERRARRAGGPSPTTPNATSSAIPSNAASSGQDLAWPGHPLRQEPGKLRSRTPPPRIDHVAENAHLNHMIRATYSS